MDIAGHDELKSCDAPISKLRINPECSMLMAVLMSTSCRKNCHDVMLKADGLCDYQTRLAASMLSSFAKTAFITANVPLKMSAQNHEKARPS